MQPPQLGAGFFNFGRSNSFPGDMSSMAHTLTDMMLPVVTVKDMSNPSSTMSFGRSLSQEPQPSPPGSPTSIGSIASDIDLSGDEDLIARLGFRVIMGPMGGGGLPPPLVGQGSNPDLLMPPTQASKLKKTYACTFCNKTFSCSSNMTRHRRIHTGQRPYKCAFCEHTFSNSSNRRKHEKSCQKRVEGQPDSDRGPNSTSPASSASLSPASSTQSLNSMDEEESPSQPQSHASSHHASTHASLPASQRGSHISVPLLGAGFGDHEDVLSLAPTPGSIPEISLEPPS